MIASLQVTMGRIVRWARHPIKYSWRLAVFQILFSVAVSYLFWIPQTPGISVALMGLVAVIMTIRAEEGWSRTERILWLTFALVLMVAEIRAIQTDRAAQQRDAKEAQIKESQRFAKVLDQNQKHFDQTLDEMKDISGLSMKALTVSGNALKQITGGGEFCYLMAVLPHAMPNGVTLYQLAKLNSGDIPLDFCHVRVYDNNSTKINPVLDRELGRLPPGKTSGVPGSQGALVDIYLPEGSYYVQIETRNNRFYEMLSIHAHEKGKGLEDIRIWDERQKTVYMDPKNQ